MQSKLDMVFDSMNALNINYTMDELVHGQDYWVNTTLGRPIRGIDFDTVPGDREMATPVNTGLAPMAVEDASNIIEVQALDVTEVVVQPPALKMDDPPGGLSVVQFFAIIIFCSMILYVMRKFNELKSNIHGHRPKEVPSDYMSKLL